MSKIESPKKPLKRSDKEDTLWRASLISPLQTKGWNPRKKGQYGTSKMTMNRSTTMNDPRNANGRSPLGWAQKALGLTNQRDTVEKDGTFLPHSRLHIPSILTRFQDPSKKSLCCLDPNRARRLWNPRPGSQPQRQSRLPQRRRTKRNARTLPELQRKWRAEKYTGTPILHSSIQMTLHSIRCVFLVMCCGKYDYLCWIAERHRQRNWYKEYSRSKEGYCRASWQ